MADSGGTASVTAPLAPAASPQQQQQQQQPGAPLRRPGSYAALAHRQQGSRTIVQTAACPPTMHRETWSFEDFSVLRMLGEGQMSSVVQCLCARSGLPAAVKMYHKDRMNSLNVKQVAREIEIHAAMQHPGIIQLYAAFEDADGIYLVEELAPRGDLFGDLSRQGGYMMEGHVVRSVLLPFLSALAYVHEQGVLHRDIKPENILMGEDGQVRVGDFGLAINVVKEKPVSRVGTLDYMPPEIVRLPMPHQLPPGPPRGGRPAAEPPRPGSYGLPVDIWCVGILAYELLIGGPPFETDSREETYTRILKTQPHLPSHLSDAAKDFVGQCLRKDPALRPTVHQLLRHPWLRPPHVRWRPGALLVGALPLARPTPAPTGPGSAGAWSGPEAALQPAPTSPLAKSESVDTKDEPMLNALAVTRSAGSVPCLAQPPGAAAAAVAAGRAPGPALAPSVVRFPLACKGFPRMAPTTAATAASHAAPPHSTPHPPAGGAAGPTAAASSAPASGGGGSLAATGAAAALHPRHPFYHSFASMASLAGSASSQSLASLGGGSPGPGELLGPAVDPAGSPCPKHLQPADYGTAAAAQGSAGQQGQQEGTWIEVDINGPQQGPMLGHAVHAVHAAPAPPAAAKPHSGGGLAAAGNKAVIHVNAGPPSPMQPAPGGTGALQLSIEGQRCCGPAAAPAGGLGEGEEEEGRDLIPASRAAGGSHASPPPALLVAGTSAALHSPSNPKGFAALKSRFSRHGSPQAEGAGAKGGAAWSPAAAAAASPAAAAAAAPAGAPAGVVSETAPPTAAAMPGAKAAAGPSLAQLLALAPGQATANRPARWSLLTMLRCTLNKRRTACVPATGAGSAGASPLALPARGASVQ